VIYTFKAIINDLPFVFLLFENESIWNCVLLNWEKKNPFCKFGIYSFQSSDSSILLISKRMAPLAELLRPISLDDYIGQEHLLGPGAILRQAIESGNIPSMILWGPPGVGKTTLAHIISTKLNRTCYTLSAISSGVKEVREVILKAREEDKSAILFIDEIHRFSKSQQDSLLGAVERGEVTLIGATTENPSFEVISPLLSRCQVYILKSLGEPELLKILERARRELETRNGFTITIKEHDALLRISGGDARKLLNAIELVVQVESVKSKNIIVTNENTVHIIQKNLAFYDKGGEMHYDVISAFIKSIRGSDPNAAVYWLARMINGGEDPLFIARRLLILASEDIGNANPNALLLANACFDAVNKIGYPECRIILSQTVTYLASSVKSNASCVAIDKAQSLVQQTGDLPVPLHIRNAPTKLMKDIGYGKNYLYAHNYEGNFIDQEFLPDKISGLKLYDPQNNPRENELRNRLRQLWKNKYGY
jgi:putative ATPase